MPHEIDLIGVALSSGLIIIVPSLVAFIFGEIDTHSVHGDGAEKFFGHFMRFLVLGFLLFFPVLIVTIEAMGHKSEVVGGEALAIWLSTGILIYWVTYVAGTSMRRVWEM